MTGIRCADSPGAILPIASSRRPGTRPTIQSVCPRNRRELNSGLFPIGLGLTNETQTLESSSLAAKHGRSKD
jgi:hypothetical protein